MVLKPTERVTATVLFAELYFIVEIPTPFEFWMGIIFGIVLLIPFVFLRIVTLPSPSLYLRSTSGTMVFVAPSKRISFGATEYPLPKEVTPIWSRVANESI